MQETRQQIIMATGLKLKPHLVITPRLRRPRQEEFEDTEALKKKIFAHLDKIKKI